MLHKALYSERNLSFNKALLVSYLTFKKYLVSRNKCIVCLCRIMCFARLNFFLFLLLLSIIFYVLDGCILYYDQANLSLVFHHNRQSVNSNMQESQHLIYCTGQTLTHDFSHFPYSMHFTQNKILVQLYAVLKQTHDCNTYLSCQALCEGL